MFSDSKDIEAGLIQFIESNRPQTTVKSYGTYASKYTSFCQLRSLPLDSPVSVAAFMKHSYDRGLRGRSTLSSTIPSSISHIFRYTDTNPCNFPLVQQMKRTLTKLANPPKQKAPLTRAHLVSLASLVTPTFDSVQDFFMILLMMTCMLRESEAVNLSSEDVWVEVVDGQRCLFAFVQISKTDQCRNGHTIVVGQAKLRQICPVHWFYAHSKTRTSTMPFLFHRGTNSRKALANTTPNHTLKRLLSSIDVDPAPYGSHSARRGGVTAAIAHGAELHLVARHGNWKSDAIFLYISDSLQAKLSVSGAILDQP